MGTTRIAYSGIAAIIVAVSLTAPLGAQQGGGSAIRIGANDLGGVVRSAKGPEAGVWVIAETDDLPTKFTKIVVTDDRGRYALPELPAATYRVWVRGYGLADSEPVSAKPGRTLNVRVRTAASPQEAAK